jgi:predicted amidohydrolase YtcJ
VTEQCLLPDLKSLTRFLDAGYKTGWGDELFRIGPLKLLVDGSLGARTALLRAPYNDAPDTCGIATYTSEALDALVLRAHSAGMQIAIHAIGDGGAELVLDAFEHAQSVCPREDARHGIVHAQVLTHEQSARMKALGLHAYIQSIFLDYDTQIVHSRLGARANEAYPAASLLKQGITLSNGSDAPVELPRALGGIQCAVTRKPFTKPLPDAYLPDEALTLEQALKSYSTYGAYASFEETKKGLIREGYLADFTVLGEDPFLTDPANIHKIPVVSVFLAGKQIL